MFDATAVSKQIGAAVLLRRMVELGHVRLEAEAWQFPIRFSYLWTAEAEELQRFLNRVGIQVAIDGKAGVVTSAAVRRVFGHFLLGDPQELKGERQ